MLPYTPYSRLNTARILRRFGNLQPFDIVQILIFFYLEKQGLSINFILSPNGQYLLQIGACLKVLYIIVH